MIVAFRKALGTRGKDSAALAACLALALFIAGLAAAASAGAVEPEPSFGIDSFLATATDSAAAPYTVAGGHPYQLTTEVSLATVLSPCQGGGDCEESVATVGDAQNVDVELPPGLTTNPSALPRCVLAKFFAGECSAEAQVGTAAIRDQGRAKGFSELGPLYNLGPVGSHSAALGFGGTLPFVFGAAIRGGSDFGITTLADGLPELGVSRVQVAIWGVPAEPSHDSLRGKTCTGISGESDEEFFAACEAAPGGGPAAATVHPFVTMPTGCTGEALPVVAHANSWQLPGEEVEAETTMPAVEGCDQLRFRPKIRAHPTTDRADSPSGFDFDLEIPQNEDPNGVAEAQMREAVLALPAGLVVNPSGADGLGACAPTQIGLVSSAGQSPVRFSGAPAECPDAAKIGSAEVDTPLLGEPLLGDIYLATPRRNPFGALLAGYIVLEGRGLTIKLAARFEASERGRITVRLEDGPQLPFEHFKLHFFEGPRGIFRTPATCGPFETTSVLTPWSAPESGPPAEPGDEFETSAGATGGFCPSVAADEPHAPRLRAGTESPRAGASSTFSLRLVREDGSQELSAVDTTLPPGLVARLAEVGECSEARLAAAGASDHSGAEERVSPSCPPGSEVGTVDIGAGAGPTPIYASGRVYLAGPYKGAPFSLAIIVPALAGPFDLGTVVVRAALHFDPETAQVHAVSDPIPTVLDGIPSDVRSVTFRSRPGFTLNPTDCEPLAFSGSALSTLGATAPLSVPFQVSGCAALAFKPRLALRFGGATGANGHPAVTAVLRPRAGDAGIRHAAFLLPRGAYLDQSHIGGVCTRARFRARSCPADSAYGRVEVWSPLLERPLRGEVYLRESSHRLPDLAADLDGQVQLVLAGRLTTPDVRVRAGFDRLPDIPFSRLELRLWGGRRGLLVDSEDVCAHPVDAAASFAAQNGKLRRLSPRIEASC